MYTFLLWLIFEPGLSHIWYHQNQTCVLRVCNIRANLKPENQRGVDTDEQGKSNPIHKPVYQQSYRSSASVAGNGGIPYNKMITHNARKCNKQQKIKEDPFMSREEMIACIKCILEDAQDWEVEQVYNMVLENVG